MTLQILCWHSLQINAIAFAHQMLTPHSVPRTNHDSVHIHAPALVLLKQVIAKDLIQTSTQPLAHASVIQLPVRLHVPIQNLSSMRHHALASALTLQRRLAQHALLPSSGTNQAVHASAQESKIVHQATYTTLLLADAQVAPQLTAHLMTRSAQVTVFGMIRHVCVPVTPLERHVQVMQHSTHRQTNAHANVTQ